MNGRVAKRLRREAERQTAQMPERRYKSFSPRRLWGCTREVYQRLKAAHKRHAFTRAE